MRFVFLEVTHVWQSADFGEALYAFSGLYVFYLIHANEKNVIFDALIYSY